MPTEERRAYMRQYMRERRASIRAASAETTEPGQDTASTSKGNSFFDWILVGIVALIVISTCIQGWRNGPPEKGTTPIIPPGYQV